MTYWYLYIPAIICFVLPLLYSIHHARSVDRKEKWNRFCEADDCCGKVLNGASIERTKECIDELQSAYADVQPFASENDRSIYRTDMDDLKSHLHDLEEDDWLRKAEPHLEKFSEYYEMILSQEFHNFRNVEELLRTKEKCIMEWQKYFSVDLSEYSTTIYPKRYMQNYLGSNYSPCVDSHEALDKKLSDCVQSMRPEYKRKMKLYKVIVDYVDEQHSIARSELLAHSFNGYVADEVKCCYRELLSRNKIVEIKLGGRYFVSLSDSEAAKRCQQSGE